MYLMSEDICVLFDGTKSFWETRSSLKIVILNHTKQNCMEIVALDPATGSEFPRIYLDSSLVISKLDKEIVENCYAAKQEILAHSNLKNNEDDVFEVKAQMMMQYAYSRIHLTSLAVEGNALQLVLQPTFDDVMVEGDESLMKLDVERLKPENLVPYKVTANVMTP